MLCSRFEPFITRYPTDSGDPLKAATQAAPAHSPGVSLYSFRAVYCPI